MGFSCLTGMRAAAVALTLMDGKAHAPDWGMGFGPAVVSISHSKTRCVIQAAHPISMVCTLCHCRLLLLCTRSKRMHICEYNFV